VSCDSKLVYDKWLQQWTFIWVYEKERQLPHENQVVCSLDPGVRTFQTWYSPTHGCGEIGAKDAQKLARICLALDDLISRTRKAPAKKRNSMRHAQARMRQCVCNLVDEVHRKTALWLVKTFDAIIIPPFNSGEMAKKAKRKIGSKTVRKMMTWAHSRFRDKLVSKAEEHGKQVFLVSEAYTSKTCSACGWIDQKLGGKKIFSCKRCGLHVDRDLNGARGIFLRGMLDGVVEFSGKQQQQYLKTSY
jgi:putative transposase